MKKIFMILIFLASVNQCFAEGEVTFYGMLGYGSNPTIREDYRTGLDQYREEVVRTGYPNSDTDTNGSTPDIYQIGLMCGSQLGLKLDLCLSAYRPGRRIKTEYPYGNLSQDTYIGSVCYSIRPSCYYNILNYDRLQFNVYGGAELCYYKIQDDSERYYVVEKQLNSSNYYIGPSAGLMLKFAVLRFDTFSIDVLADGWATWAYYDEYMGRKSLWSESFAGSIGIGMTVENMW